MQRQISTQRERASVMHQALMKGVNDLYEQRSHELAQKKLLIEENLQVLKITTDKLFRANVEPTQAIFAKHLKEVSEAEEGLKDLHLDPHLESLKADVCKIGLTLKGASCKRRRVSSFLSWMGS